MRRISHGGQLGLEVICKDRGPGIPDVAQAMQDGFSTVGMKIRIWVLDHCLSRNLYFRVTEERRYCLRCYPAVSTSRYHQHG